MASLASIAYHMLCTGPGIGPGEGFWNGASKPRRSGRAQRLPAGTVKPAQSLGIIACDRYPRCTNGGACRSLCQCAAAQPCPCVGLAHASLC